RRSPSKGTKSHDAANGLPCDGDLSSVDTRIRHGETHHRLHVFQFLHETGRRLTFLRIRRVIIPIKSKRENAGSRKFFGESLEDGKLHVVALPRSEDDCRPFSGKTGIRDIDDDLYR